MKHDINTVIETGQELFRTQGYFNTGTEEILKSSGYPRSSFYYHFKSKDDLYIQIVETTFNKYFYCLQSLPQETSNELSEKWKNIL